MRFSTIPGDILDDSVSTPRGLAIKVIGVEGERLEGSEARSTPGDVDCSPGEPDSVQISWDTPCDSGSWLFEPSVGCRMWDWHPAPEDAPTWTGACKGGKKAGYGVAQWFEHG